LPTGAKGFGGTEGFMAPEIVKYNGEEEYTEKVDCFSFGMFIYELVSLNRLIPSFSVGRKYSKLFSSSAFSRLY
jgi:serine/threonine protein kinase